MIKCSPIPGSVFRFMGEQWEQIWGYNRGNSLFGVKKIQKIEQTDTTEILTLSAFGVRM